MHMDSAVFLHNDRLHTSWLQGLSAFTNGQPSQAAKAQPRYPLTEHTPVSHAMAPRADTGDETVL